MNQQINKNSEAPLLSYDYDSNISQRNMSSLSFLNYYKEPYYHEVAGIITDMYIPTFIHPNHCFVGYNYDEEEYSEEDAKYFANKMFFSQCEFHFRRKNDLDTCMGSCTADLGNNEHNDDLVVFSGLHSDTFDAWVKAIKACREKSFRFGFKIEFNQHARDVFLGQLLMNYRGERMNEDYEYLDFNLSNIEIQFSYYENYAEFQLSPPAA